MKYYRLKIQWFKNIEEIFLWNSIPVWHRKIHICNLCTELKSLSNSTLCASWCNWKVLMPFSMQKRWSQKFTNKISLDVFLDVSIFHQELALRLIVSTLIGFYVILISHFPYFLWVITKEWLHNENVCVFISVYIIANEANELKINIKRIESTKFQLKHT